MAWSNKNEYGGTYGFTEIGRSQMVKGRFFDEEFTDEGEKIQLWKNRRLISRDTPINGGVSLTWVRNEGKAFERDALIVDDSIDDELKRVYQLLESRISSQQTTQEVLELVLALAEEELPYSEARTKQFKTEFLLKKYGATTGSLNEPQDIQIGEFVKAKTGICKQQALLVGFLVEKLIVAGKLKGRVSVDRSFIEEKNGERRGHSFVRFFNEQDVEMILDPSIEYVGELSAITDRESLAFYTRPQEKLPREDKVEILTKFLSKIKKKQAEWWKGGSKHLELDGGKSSFTLQSYQDPTQPNLDLSFLGSVITRKKGVGEVSFGILLKDKLLTKGKGDIQVSCVNETWLIDCESLKDVGMALPLEERNPNFKYIPWQDLNIGGQKSLPIRDKDHQYEIELKNGYSFRVYVRAGELVIEHS